MKGLELARVYYETHGDTLLGALGAYRDEVAIGLAGPGSDCFGFDDEISRDHDWGPGLGVWVHPEAGADVVRTVQAAYARLPDDFGDIRPRSVTQWSTNRVGVMNLGEWLRWLIGVPGSPASLGEWLRAPEDGLACCINGELFHDPSGVFSGIRATLSQGPPEDLWRFRLASACQRLGQAAEYNFPRCLARGDLIATQLTLSIVAREAMRIVYLVNRRYRPPYKWQHRGLLELPIHGVELHRQLQALLSATRPGPAEVTLASYLCSQLADVFVSQGLAHETRELSEHGLALHAAITDPQLRRTDVWATL